MGDSLAAATLLRDHRIARLATHAPPAWLWHADLSRLFWANATGAACLRVPTLEAISELSFSPADARRVQVARVAGRLYPGALPLLSRLRGMAPGIGQALVCACSRIVVGNAAAILVAAQELAGPDLPLAARVEFLLAGSDEAMAAFAPDGRLIAATPSARALLGNANATAAIDADSLAIAALAEGAASGDTRLGRAWMIRVGHDETTVLIACFMVVAEGTMAAPAASRDAPAIVCKSMARAKGLAPSRQPVMTRAVAGKGTEARPVDERAAAEVSPLQIDQPSPDRRVPLRFLWQMDQSGRFTLGSDAFIDAIGPRTAVMLGRPWSELAAELDLDPDNEVLSAIETRETWSGIVVSFPIDGSGDRVWVELSGLPVYDRDRTFIGYRGFGVCRDVERLTQLGWVRRAPMFPAAHSEPPSVPTPTAATLPRRQEGAAIDAAEAILALLQQTDGDLTIGPDPLEEAGAVGDPLPDPPARPENILLFPAGGADPRPRAAPPAALSLGEHDAFQEIARRLQARRVSTHQSGSAAPDQASGAAPAPADMPSSAPDPVRPAKIEDEVSPPANAAPPAIGDGSAPVLTEFLNELPVGLMIYRYDQPLFANCAFLAATGFSSFEDLIQSGGLDSVPVGPDAESAAGRDKFGQPLTIIGRGGREPITARLMPVPWAGESALALVLTQPAVPDGDKSTELAQRRSEAQVRELRSILDTAFDGFLVLSRDGVILSANRSAQVLFGYEPAELAGLAFGDLFVPASRQAVLDHFGRAYHGGADAAASRQEVTGQTRQGQAVPLSLVLGAMAKSSDTLYAVLRDLTPGKKAEQALPSRQSTDSDRANHAELLANFSTSVRDVLNSIIGCADLMLEERFGPLGNDRYRNCLRNVRAASHRIGGLVDDINNLARPGSGAPDLTFMPVDLNILVRGCVSALQADANRHRTIIRSSLAPDLPPVVADARSLWRVVDNLLSSALRHAGPGGQVIVSTGETERGQVVLRVRDTGATGRKPANKAGRARPDECPSSAAPPDATVDMALARTLAEANRGTLSVSSSANVGTLFELSFPGRHVPAE